MGQKFSAHTQNHARYEKMVPLLQSQRAEKKARVCASDHTSTPIPYQMIRTTLPPRKGWALIGNSARALKTVPAIHSAIKW